MALEGNGLSSALHYEEETAFDDDGEEEDDFLSSCRGNGITPTTIPRRGRTRSA